MKRDYAMLVAGEWVQASDGGTFDTVNPATGEVWATVPEATAEDVDRAVRAAHAACWEGPWSRMTPTERGRVLRRIGDLLAERSEEIGAVETRDSGKLFAETRWQASYIAEFYHFYAGAADKMSGDTLPIDKPDMFVFSQREPLGVVAAVIPWNSQLFLTAIKLGPALAAGNAVVVKTSEHAPAPLLEFGQLLSQAGLPDGVVSILTGRGEPCGSALTSHPLVSRVAFTGGPDAARRVIANTASNLAEVSLELGGKSPFVVFPDADMENAVNAAVSGIFAASGQSCVAGSRLVVHEEVADEFVGRLAEVARGIRLGDPMLEDTQMGPLCTSGQIERIEREIAGAAEQGAQVVCGGARARAAGEMFFEPTIVECPDPSAKIAATELFGPVLCVQRFSSEEEAVSLANAGEHGLAAGIFTRDAARAVRMSRAIRAGVVWVNTYRAISPIAEFGGFKASGHGREGGMQALYDYTRSKTVWMNLSSEPAANPFQPR